MSKTSEPHRPPENTDQDDVRTIASDQLLKGESRLRITHAGETYMLMRTKNNRLILQK